MMTDIENGTSGDIVIGKDIMTEFRFSESFVSPQFLRSTPAVLSTLSVRVDNKSHRVWLNAIVNWSVYAGPAKDLAVLLFEILRGGKVIYSIAQSASLLPRSVAFMNVQLQHVDANPLAGYEANSGFVQYRLRVSPLSIPAGVFVTTLSQVFTAVELKAADM